MSKFFKALEQAEQERALRQQAEPSPLSQAASPSVSESPRPPELRRASELAAELPGMVDDHLVSLLMPTSFEAEQYRALRHLVEQLHKTANLSVVAVSSPAGGDGKTVTAINLAGALAQASEARVLLVDADLRGPSVAQRLGLEEASGPGLVDAILDSRHALEAAVRQRSPFNLWVLPAGQPPTAPYEVCKSPRFGELLEQARREYDYVILDTSPVVAVPDCRVIGKWADGFLLVVAAHQTPRKLVEEALNLMDPAKMVGLVFNGDDHPLSEYSYTYGRAADGNGGGWWARAARKVGGRLKPC